MEINALLSSRWVTEFHKRWVRGKNVLLHGNVADQFLVNDEYQDMQKFLARFFQSKGYELIVEYDFVEGFRVPDEKRSLFNRLSGDRRRAGDASGAQERAILPETPSTAAGAAAAAGGQTRQKPVAGGTPRELTVAQQARNANRVDTFEDFAAFERLLRQTKHATAVVVHFGDRLVSNTKQQQEPERKALVCLMKAMQDAVRSTISQGPVAGYKNMLVIVGSHLEAVPEWLLRDNTFIELLEVSRPRTDERMTFLRKRIQAFQGGRELGLEPDSVERAAVEFGNLTDGFTWWDLEAVRRTSVVEQIPIGSMRELIDYYKFGDRDDPWEKLGRERVNESRRALENRVIGQTEAVNAVVQMIKAAREGVTMAVEDKGGGRPKGVFFFVGPTGVGKTELAKALTELIFTREDAFARFDMSEYAEQHAAEKLAGAPPGYVGYDEGGLLTNRVRERPFSLLLFDEIEKAHPRLMDKFLQILDDGRLTDGKGRTTYFSQTVIIFTSNIGSGKRLQERLSSPEPMSYEEVQKHYLQAVRTHFHRRLRRPELLGRLGENILVFDVLRPEYVVGIFEKFIGLLSKSLQKKRQMAFELPDDSLRDHIGRLMAQPENRMLGGRRIRALLESLVERPLNAWLFDNPNVGSRVLVTYSEATGKVRFDDEPKA